MCCGDLKKNLLFKERELGTFEHWMIFIFDLRLEGWVRRLRGGEKRQGFGRAERVSASNWQMVKGKV